MKPPIQQPSTPIPLPPLICPVCREALLLEARTYRCENNHCFDLAKEGYLNLLLSHQRKSKNAGDDKAMIQARRRFFDSGAYNPLASKISHLISRTPHPAVLDCGCGEGALSGELPAHIVGMDISKEAVRTAAKRYKTATWIVANGMRDIPFADNSIDIILSVLAPRNPGEFARILKPGGTLILGVPGPNHLIELRRELNTSADDFEEKTDEAAAKCAPALKEVERELLTYSVQLDRQQITDLIQMTPIFWTSAPETKKQLFDLAGLEVTVCFALLSLKSL